MIDWQTLLAAPYGVPLAALCERPELVLQELGWRRYRTAPNQYLDVFEDPADGELKYRSFAWIASEGAAQIIYMRRGSAAIGVAELPPVVLLPGPELLSVDEIAAHGLRTEPGTFTRYVNLTHQVTFGAFRYHYERVNPRSTDAPIAIEVDRDPDLHIRLA